MTNSAINLTGLSLTQTAACAGVQVETVRRWICDGVRGVKLQAIRVGNRWRISEQALKEFIEALQRT